MTILIAIVVIFGVMLCESAVGSPVYHDSGDETFGKCRMPGGEAGNCIPLTKCPPLFKLFMDASLTVTDEDFLKRCQCGYIPRAPLVCCPSSVEAIETLIEDRNGRTFSVDDLPIPGRCGTYDEKETPFGLIMGGQPSGIHESPWMALLKYTKPDDGVGFHCGGTLIHERYVMTAAHCVIGSELRRQGMHLMAVRLGEWDLSQTEDCEDDLCADPVVDVPIESIHVHAMYNPTSRKKKEHDIALIRLAKRVDFTEWIKPICLPIDDATEDRNFADVELQVVGWGYTSADATASTSDVKMKATLSGMAQDQCVERYRSKRVQLTDNQMCAGGELGIDSCSGDSGSPLMEYNESADSPHWLVVGIVSFGLSECGQENWPGVYTRVDKYIPWILNTMRH